MLAIDLDSVMQSYGEAGQTWSVRRSLPFPTKSAIVGMIATAGGYYGHDGLMRTLSDAITLTVCVRRWGSRFTDYQTINGGTISAERTPKGAPVVRRETIISPREYIADGSFLALINGSDIALAHVEKVLADPVGVVYLGRASCPPAVPLLARRIEAIPDGYTTITECTPTAPGALLLRDNLYSFTARSYRPRWVTVSEGASHVSI